MSQETLKPKQPKPAVFSSHIRVALDAAVNPTFAAGKHTLSISHGGCTLNLFRGNAMVQSTFDIEDLSRLGELFTFGQKEWERALEIERKANEKSVEENKS